MNQAESRESATDQKQLPAGAFTPVSSRDSSRDSLGSCSQSPEEEDG